MPSGSVGPCAKPARRPRAVQPEGASGVVNLTFLAVGQSRRVNVADAADLALLLPIMVPEPRFELGRPCGPRSLSPLRLPFRHSGRRSVAERGEPVSRGGLQSRNATPSATSQIDQAM